MEIAQKLELRFEKHINRRSVPSFETKVQLHFFIFQLCFSREKVRLQPISITDILMNIESRWEAFIFPYNVILIPKTELHVEHAFNGFIMHNPVETFH